LLINERNDENLTFTTTYAEEGSFSVLFFLFLSCRKALVHQEKQFYQLGEKMFSFPNLLFYPTDAFVSRIVTRFLFKETAADVSEQKYYAGN
jgi:hypothetical protein